MRLKIKLTIIPLLTLTTAQTLPDACPKSSYDCLDVINSSQCLSLLIFQKALPLTKENMVKCVEFYDSATNSTGGDKVRGFPFLFFFFLFLFFLFVFGQKGKGGVNTRLIDA